jgi:hypothetical protein
MCLNRFARAHSHHLGPLPEVSQTIQFRPAGNDRLEFYGYANEISKLPFFAFRRLIFRASITSTAVAFVGFKRLLMNKNNIPGQN